MRPAPDEAAILPLHYRFKAVAEPLHWLKRRRSGGVADPAGSVEALVSPRFVPRDGGAASGRDSDAPVRLDSFEIDPSDAVDHRLRASALPGGADGDTLEDELEDLALLVDLQGVPAFA